MFSVGDVVILIGADNSEAQKYIGDECTIIEVWSENPYWPGAGYVLDLPKSQRGGSWIAPAKDIRRKDGYDGNTKITWDDMPYWKPRELIRV